MNIYSIIIPMYNSKSVIIESLNSVFKQKFDKNYEVIIVDDCSTDDSVEVVKKYIKDNNINNIILIENKVNRKQGYSRNRAMEISKGEYLIFLDADDKLYDDLVLQKLYEIIKENTVDIVYADLKATNERDFEIKLNKETFNKEEMLMNFKWANVLAKCFNRKFIMENNIMFLEDILYEDLYFYFLSIYYSKTFEIAEFYMYNYVAQKESSMATKTFTQTIYTIKLIEELVKLKDIIKKEDIYLLEGRIKQQRSRILPRLDRAIDKNFNIDKGEKYAKSNCNNTNT